MKINEISINNQWNSMKINVNQWNSNENYENQ